MPRSSGSRKESAAPTAEVADLDDINIDDMFKGGLFEGLDIDEDMEGMADITDSKASPQTNKRTKTTKQRKSGGNGSSSANLDAVELNLFEDIGVPDGVSGPATAKPPSSSATTASITTKSGRRTKRKIHKADDEDDEYEPAPKKPKRKPKPTAKARATKKKGSKAAAVEAPIAAAAPAPAPKLSKGRKVLPLNRNNADATAIGGTRANKRKLPKASSVTAPKATTAPTPAPPPRTAVDATKVTAVASAPPAPPPISVAKQGRQRSSAANAELSYEKLMDTSTCGLKPSRSLFYPFLPGLPPELHIKKYSKNLSVLDRIHQAYAGDTSKKTAASSSQASGGSEKKHKEPPAKEADPIYQLLVSELEHWNAAPSSSATLLLQRRQAMGTSIASGRRMIGHSDQMALVQDLRAVSALLTRQFDFLTQSLENMEHWCKDNFSPADYTQVFDPNAAAALAKEAIASGGSGNKRRKSGLAKGSLLASLSGPTVQIKIVSSDFKLHKPFSPVTAYVGAASQAAPKKARSSKAAGITDGGRVGSSKSASSNAHPTAPPPPIKTYAELRPDERRLRIVEAIRQKALSLDRGEEDSDKATKMLEKRHAAAAKVIEEELEAANAAQNNLLMGMANTSTLWKWVDKAGFYGSLTRSDVSEMQSAVQEPEPLPEPCYWEEHHRKDEASLPSGEKPKKADKSIVREEKERRPEASKASTLAERITDLLVDEGSEDDEDDDSDDESILDGWTTSSTENSTKIDLSMFNYEERVFIHLRSIGLVDENCPPPVAAEDDEDDEASCSRDLSADELSARDEQGEFDDVLQAMQDDLIRIQKRNNARGAYLEKVSTTQMLLDKQRKRKDDQDNLLINKHNQLLKKQKESKKGKQKQVKKGEQNWMPW